MALIEIQLGSPFTFNFDEQVKIADSSNTGKVVGRAQIKESENMYLIRYSDPVSGPNIEEWIRQSRLSR